MHFGEKNICLALALWQDSCWCWGGCFSHTVAEVALWESFAVLTKSVVPMWCVTRGAAEAEAQHPQTTTAWPTQTTTPAMKIQTRPILQNRFVHPLVKPARTANRALVGEGLAFSRTAKASAVFPVPQPVLLARTATRVNLVWKNSVVPAQTTQQAVGSTAIVRRTRVVCKGSVKKHRRVDAAMIVNAPTVSAVFAGPVKR